VGHNFLSYGCDQDFLLPPDARDWLPAGHLSWAVIDAVGELDLSEFLAYYRSDGQGRPAYHPKMMTALVLYCYCKGIRSSRAVQMACFDDVGCRRRRPGGRGVGSPFRGRRASTGHLLRCGIVRDQAGPVKTGCGRRSTAPVELPGGRTSLKTALTEPARSWSWQLSGAGTRVARAASRWRR
jgi:Transposase domain (DUF772)